MSHAKVFLPKRSLALLNKLAKESGVPRSEFLEQLFILGLRSYLDARQATTEHVVTRS